MKNCIVFSNKDILIQILEFCDVSSSKEYGDLRLVNKKCNEFSFVYMPVAVAARQVWNNPDSFPNLPKRLQSDGSVLDNLTVKKPQYLETVVDILIAKGESALVKDQQDLKTILKTALASSIILHIALSNKILTLIHSHIRTEAENLISEFAIDKDFRHLTDSKRIKCAYDKVHKANIYTYRDIHGLRSLEALFVQHGYYCFPTERDDKDILLDAIKLNYRVFKKARWDLKEDADVVLAVMRAIPKQVCLIERFLVSIEFRQWKVLREEVGSSLKEDRNFVRALQEMGFSRALEYAN